MVEGLSASKFVLPLLSQPRDTCFEKGQDPKKLVQKPAWVMVLINLSQHFQRL